MNRFFAAIRVLTLAILIALIPAAQGVAQNISTIDTTITQVDYAEGTVGFLTDNGQFSFDFDTDVLSLYLNAAEWNRFPVRVHYKKIMFGEGPNDWYLNPVKLECHELGILIVTQDGAYVDYSLPRPGTITPVAPHPDYVKKDLSIQTQIINAEVAFAEGEWYTMETNHPQYRFFSILKSDFSEETFNKLASVVQEMIARKNPVTIYFRGAPKAGVELQKINFPGYGTVNFK